MSTLRHEREHADLPEPDSELRAALQRVARDLEHDSRHQGREENIESQRDKQTPRPGHRQGASIHVEDILDQSALAELDVDDVTTYELPGTESAVPSEASPHAQYVSPRSSSTPTQQVPRRILDNSSRVSSPPKETTDGANSGIVTLLGCIPTLGFMNFVDDWLESQGLKAPDDPSPVRQAWNSLDPAQRAAHETRAKNEFDRQTNNDTSQAEETRSFAGNAGRNRQTSGAPGSGGFFNASSKRELIETEKSTVDCFVKNIVQQLDILYQASGTNYLLLTAPVFQPADSFPVLSHSPPAEGFWQGLRGGPGTNLTKFLALSHPTVTSRRLAIPSGARSLDVKSRLNASMRQMIREASNVADAEMKWTRPESLVQIYGVKIVGWPTGAPGEADEAVPMRNPSNNSVAQNKLLLSRIEAGTLRVEVASDSDRSIAFGTQNAPSDSQELLISRDGAAEPGTAIRDNDDIQRQSTGQPGSTNSTSQHHSESRKDARPAKLREIAPSSRSKYRSKSLLTLNPDGTIRPGGLEGKRKPGRPRKEMPVSAEELPHLSTSYEYHANQRRLGNESGSSSANVPEIGDTIDEETGEHCQSLYGQSEDLPESNSDLALLMEPTVQHPVHNGSGRYPEDPEDHHQHQDSVSDSVDPPHRHPESSLSQALSHIEYYHVTGPNFGGRATHPSSLSRSHVLNNIAPHFPLPPPGSRNSSHQTMNQEDQQYLTDFGSRIPVMGAYSGHFPDQTAAGVDSHDPWHEQRESAHTSSHPDGLLPEGSPVSMQGGRHHVHHHQMDDNPDIVDGIDMEAAFGNPHILTDSLEDRGGVGEIAELQMRSFLGEQHAHAEPDEEMELDGHHLKGKRKANEMLESGES
ncbi:hypothetical protein NliqN6_2530 [Naganishia liquefaciens]|uniref:Uncharacterized protein n=1 Tax=Naganishia liquefaciens TaxID=104408 RepID=A0A8H3TS44_9TREE|nr:hypothetical protein NliqN6_2530 [Naganishia liquefaciens]